MVDFPWYPDPNKNPNDPAFVNIEEPLLDIFFKE